MLIGVEGCASRFEAERQHIFGIKLDCFRFMGIMTMPRSQSLGHSLGDQPRSGDSTLSESALPVL